MIEIGKKDGELLFHLSLNARATLKELSKKTHLSQEVIHYRINRLEGQGIIEGYYAVINTYRMGMTFYRVYMKTVNMTTAQEREFMAYLKSHPKITWIVELEGDLSFLYVVWARNIHEFENVYRDINNRFSTFVQQKYFSVMTSVHYLKSKYLNHRSDHSFLLTGGEIRERTFDATDQALVETLSQHGRMPVTALAKILHISAKAAMARKNKLEKEGILTGYTVKINHKKLGYTQRKVMLNLNNNSEKTIRSLIEFIKKQHSTIYITLAIGQYDFEFEMMEKNNQEFHHLLGELKDAFPGLLRDYFTVIFYDEPKVGQLSSI